MNVAFHISWKLTLAVVSFPEATTGDRRRSAAIRGERYVLPITERDKEQFKLGLHGRLQARLSYSAGKLSARILILRLA